MVIKIINTFNVIFVSKLRTSRNDYVRHVMILFLLQTACHTVDSINRDE